MIVTMAIVTTLAMPPSLRWALSRLPLDEEERYRLERETFEAKGFLSKVERLLVLVDDSVNGRLAERLAGLIAGSREITTTVLHLGHQGHEAALRATSTGSSAGVNGERTTTHVMLHTDAFAAESAVGREVQKGYGLLVLGIANTEAPQGGFHEAIARIAAMYEGPFAVVVARGLNAERAREVALNILTPVRGNKVSRRATEVALAIAKMSDSPMTALYVLGTVGLGATQRRLRRLTRTHHHEEAVLKDIVELADREGRSIRTALRLDVSPEDAILRQARRGHNLIVLGVGRPAGEMFFFGEVAGAILENSDCSIMFVSS